MEEDCEVRVCGVRFSFAMVPQSGAGATLS